MSHTTLAHAIFSRMGVVILFTIEFNYSRLIQHEMLKKPVTYMPFSYERLVNIITDLRESFYHTDREMVFRLFPVPTPISLIPQLRTFRQNHLCHVCRLKTSCRTSIFALNYIPQVFPRPVLFPNYECRQFLQYFILYQL